MKLSKFGYGGLGFYVNDAKMPGKQYSNFGDEYIRPAMFDNSVTDYVYEFGEIVEIVSNTRTNYIVKPIDEDTEPTANLAVVMHETTGGQAIREGRVTNGVPNVVINAWDLQLNTAKITVPLLGTDPINVEGDVFIGNGTNGTLAGALYPEEIIGGTIKHATLKIGSKEMTPSTTDVRSIAIGKGI